MNLFVNFWVSFFIFYDRVFIFNILSCFSFNMLNFILLVWFCFVFGVSYQCYHLASIIFYLDYSNLSLINLNRLNLLSFFYLTSLLIVSEVLDIQLLFFSIIRIVTSWISFLFSFV